MAPDRPEVTLVPGFYAAAVEFEVRVRNPTPSALRSVRLTPLPVPAGTAMDREGHLIPLLGPRKERSMAFKLWPSHDQDLVALDVVVEWEDETGSRKGRLQVSGAPVELSCPPLHGPKGGLDRWRSGLSGGVAVEVRMRHASEPDRLKEALESALEGVPGEADVQKEESLRGTQLRAWVRAEGGKGTRAGLLVAVTPDPRKGGSRVLVTASATTERLLGVFYHACVHRLEAALPGIAGIRPHSLTEHG